MAGGATKQRRATLAWHALLHSQQMQILIDYIFLHYNNSDALDELGLKRYCCRRMLLTHVGKSNGRQKVKDICRKIIIIIIIIIIC